MYTILGAGLTGISVADHLVKRNIPYELYEGKAHGGGHIHSEIIDGFTWDEGPHVSFTKHKYVKDYFAANCDDKYLEYPTKPTNFFEGNWVMHPAQSNLYAVPEPLRTQCVDDLIKIRKNLPDSYQPQNYQEWITYAFGNSFADTFSKIYTQKYWTTAPENLTTDWIGKRIYFPEINDMVESARGPLTKETHYISKVRYPERGGYYSYIKAIEERLQIRYRKRLSFISFTNKELTFDDGEKVTYQKLISTLPLPQLILNSDAPQNIKLEARKLKCSQVLLINVIVKHPPAIDNHWIYVYDKDMYSTRINFTDLLAPLNGEPGKSGLQVEVYFSDYHPLSTGYNEVAEAVLKELIQMKLINGEDAIQSYHTRWIDWANVIFDENRIKAQNEVLNWLTEMGLNREQDDLEPMTEWKEKEGTVLGDIILGGRFAQWKYYWTDDCVMRAKFISDNIKV